MADFPTPWASIGQGLEMGTPCDPSAGDDCAGTAHRWPRLLADLQEHGYPQETKQEETQ